MSLRERLGELEDLRAVGALMFWDTETNMPPGGSEDRGRAHAALERVAHERLTDPALAELLEQHRDDPELGPAARVLLRDVDRARRIPGDLVAERARASAAARPAWLAAREARDVTGFLPALERNLALCRDVAACFPEAAHPYDALLDEYEPGATLAQLQPMFDRLREGLVPLVEEIAAAPAPPALPTDFPIEAQRTLSLEMAQALGFDEQTWRLDLAVHPFATTVGPGDHRVTARYHGDDLAGLFAVLHEMGHGMYEAQTDPALRRLFVGGGVSLGIHESQSRLWENLVGRSRPFWQHWLPRAQELLPALQGWALDDVLRSINVVRPTLIRVEADEVTYTLHVLLRFRLEAALLDGTLAVGDLRDAWNDGMRELLGIEVPDDTAGVLQDIHWCEGLIGYFPTYALGNVVAAQLWQAIGRDLPGLDASIAAGDLAPLRDWLREHVHCHGRLLLAPELLEQATGARLDPEPFLAGLRAKYGALYSLSG